MPYRNLSKTRADLDAVYEVSKALATSLDVTKTFREALNYLLQACEWRRGFVLAAEHGGDALRGLSAAGLSREEVGRLHFKRGEGIVGRVHATGVPVVVPDVREEPLFLNRSGGADQSPYDTVAMMALPIRADRRALGVLVIDCLNPNSARSFTDDLQLLKMVATLMGQAMLLNQTVAAAYDSVQEDVRRAQKSLPRTDHQIDQVVGVSPPMQEVFRQVHQVAPAKTTVLLRGESGTGKEVIARAIHNLSPRKREAFVSVNCAALTESLLESELFGHEKGSFTGAQGLRKGRFELAHGGTLFLDEIGDISSSFQAKLLRVLQEREFERVGGTQSVKVNVRLILATNRNLERMVKEGEFRSDLYYRINVVNIQLPPLRERREDIAPMAQHFLDRFNRENDRKIRLSPTALHTISRCYWPGNVRELENCVERTATMTKGDLLSELSFPCSSNSCLTQALHHIERDDAVRPGKLSSIPIREMPMYSPSHAGAGAETPLPGAGNPVNRSVYGAAGGAAPDHSDEATHPAGEPSAAALHPDPTVPQDGGPALPLRTADDKPEGERERLIWAMERCGWVQAKAARLLKLSPRQMGYALRKYGIEVRKF